MADLDSATVSELDQSISVVTEPRIETEGEGAEKETTWQSTNWTKYNGYYKEHNPVKAVINKLGTWTVGRGIKGEEETIPELNA